MSLLLFLKLWESILQTQVKEGRAIFALGLRVHAIILGGHSGRSVRQLGTFVPSEEAEGVECFAFIFSSVPNPWKTTMHIYVVITL